MAGSHEQSRRERLLDGLDRDALGIELAPWFRPLAPKREGWNVLTLDILSTDELIARARADPNIPDDWTGRIEMVDIVGSAQDIGAIAGDRGIAGGVDHVLSSHNFEHLPDPITFLHGCERALKPGGRLVMAVPDLRGCFDYFRPVSTTVDLLAAHRERRVAPPPEAWLAQNFLNASVDMNGVEVTSFPIDTDPQAIRLRELVEPAYEQWQREGEAGGAPGYRDAHCWAFTPASFELILHDLAYLGVTTMRTGPAEASGYDEFYVALTHDPDAPRPERAAFYTRRTELLHRIRDELAITARHTRALERRVEALTLAGRLRGLTAAVRRKAVRVQETCGSLTFSRASARGFWQNPGSDGAGPEPEGSPRR